MNAFDEQVARLQQLFGPAIIEVLMPASHLTDVPIVFVQPNHIVEVLDFLKNGDRFEYDFLADLTASDELPAEPRYLVIYNLFSTTRFWRLRVKVCVAESEPVPSITGLWPGANWAEREIHDMYGIPVANHPDLRRILNDERFQGFPLRKDYDLRKYQIFNDAPAINKNLLDRKS
ncbi:MAG: NADH-quinone oxidoreductase subunit C [Deltaproteobacteria bacterium]|nr:NADH-quinone oxidoreductase subunit C [Deltaproteobacteria bacterium]